jgi:protein-S-isoprenylcysteine O-methyltransferase Ste14
MWVAHRSLDVSTLVTNTVLTIYLIVGTVLEERKLLMEYSEEYRRYQNKVSMLVPFKYLKGMILKAVN